LAYLIKKHKLAITIYAPEYVSMIEKAVKQPIEQGLIESGVDSDRCAITVISAKRWVHQQRYPPVAASMVMDMMHLAKRVRIVE
jgi:hypothetical protein